MRLCALLGVYSRDALKRLLTHRDYLDWLDLYREDPWDGDRADLRAGIAAAAALAPYTKKGHQPKPADFLIYAKPKVRCMSAEQIRSIATVAAKRWNKRVEEMKAKKHGN